MEKPKLAKRLTRKRLAIWLTIGLLLCFIIWASSLSVMADCVWHASAKAWVDSNQDGRWDTTEPALAGVRFGVDDVWNKHEDVGGEAISDSNGEAQLLVWLPSCPWVVFQAYAEPPAGYGFTTQSRLWAFGDGPFSFGFVPTP